MTIRTHHLLLAAVLATAPGLLSATDAPNLPAGGAGPANDLDFVGWTGLSGFRAGAGMAWLTYGGSSYGCANSTPGGGRRELFFPFTLPEDNRNQFVRVWGFKAGGTPDVVVSVVRACASQTQGVPQLTTLGTTAVDGAPGEFSTFLAFDEDPAPLDCQYWASLSFGDGSATCTAAADSLRLTRVRVQSELPGRIFRSGFHTNVP
jgi:hypothetical protein